MPTDTLSRIRARGHIGIRLGLARMQALLAELGDPQTRLDGVLVGGTNGKGSVVAMVTAVLHATGFSTGSSPSPHLHSYRERVTIDGRPIGSDDLEGLLTEVLAASQPGEAKYGPATEFELMTAAAYLWSARQAVDVMVMEVGLGGRLDASNTWDPQVAAVTNVGLDHQEFLGDDILSVAAEKAAIIKPGSRAVTGAQGDALTVISERARDAGAPLEVCKALPILGSDSAGLRLAHPRLGELRLPLLGRHQAANAAVALGVVEALGASGVASVPDDAIRSGLAVTSWPGRLEPIEHGGLTVVLDGAHNPEGMSALASTLDELTPWLPAGRATLILGVMRDKDVDRMMAALAASNTMRGAHCITTAVPETERALPATTLAERWRAAGGSHAVPVDDADVALEGALAATSDAGGVLVIAGSLYLVGHLRTRLVPTASADRDA